MKKLSKEESKRHAEAMALVELERLLSEEEKEFILDNFHEGATNLNSLAGAFFTPKGLARDFVLEVPDGDIVDLCAGIGRLAFTAKYRARRLVCVEQNPEYVRVGKRVVPEAEWIQGDVFEVWKQIGKFDVAISNPPFGNISARSYEGPVTSSIFEYKVIEIASRLAKVGAFIIPQGSSPFALSGRQMFQEQKTEKYSSFAAQTGIDLTPNCGIDTAPYLKDWKGVSPLCEIVIADFRECDLIYGKGSSLDLFAA